MSIRRFSQFTVRTLLITVTLVCVWLAWHSARTRELQRRSECAQLVDEWLVGAHWQHWTPKSQLAPSRAALALQSKSDRGIRASILLSNGKFQDGRLADNFEQQMLNRWSNAPNAGASSEPEMTVRHSLGGSLFTYYTAIRAKKSCLTCHQVPGGSSAKNVGLLAIAKMEVPE